MDFEISSGICSKCTGFEDCTKYCMLHSGKALVNFLNNADMINTNIGDYKSRNNDGVQDLVVSGYQVWDEGAPSWLLTGISTTLDASPKFKNIYSKTPNQVVKAYCESAGISKEETNELIDKIQRLNKNRLLVLPFKPRTQFTTDIGRDSKTVETTISSVKWSTDKDTFRLNCVITFKFPDANGKENHCKYSITDYIDKFKMSSLEMHSKDEKHDKRLIKVTDHGIFKPIALREDNMIVAIDGTYMYTTINGNTHIIGYWDDKDNLVINSNIKSAAIKKIKDNVGFLKNHRRFIAPYLMYDANEIKIGK